MRSRGILFVVSAPSGAGKTTLCRRLCEVFPEMLRSVSYTTRAPRPGEIDGVHYTFVGVEKFRAMVERNEFVEWAEVHGNYYGTSAKMIENIIESGNDMLLDIDVQGAAGIKQLIPEVVPIFILPPSYPVLRERLMGRGSDSDEVIEKRLKKAHEEVTFYKAYDYVIVNDSLEDALKEFSAIVIAERARTTRTDNEWIREKFFNEVQQ